MDFSNMKATPKPAKVPKRRKVYGYANVYPTSGGTFGIGLEVYFYRRKESAVQAGKHRVKCVTCALVPVESVVLRKQARKRGGK